MTGRWLCIWPLLACAQTPPMDPNMPGMDHSKMAGMDHSQAHAHGNGMNPAGMLVMNLASGTSLNPESWAMPMVMKSYGSWRTMFMANAYLVATQQSGPRGGDKVYAPNWFMGSVEHSAGKGSVMIQWMGSLDPVTITQRRYPLLFQTGETAYGNHIVDGQHPHDLFMGLGIHYARPVGESTSVHLYFAPVGDPALGPVAFPHRASAAELPQAALGHHWQDSTHIANEVVTLGVTHRKVRLEASGFYGTEPNENRWNIDYGPINSWSARLSVFPAKNWLGQVSVGRIARPERGEPGDVVRSTASLHYSRPMAGASWSSSFIWGRNHNTANQRDLNSYLAETVVPVRSRNFVTARVEFVDKDELFSNDHALEHLLEHSAGSVFGIGAYTAGLHAGCRLDTGRRNGDRSEPFGLHASGGDQTLLWGSAGGGEYVSADSFAVNATR